MKDRLKKNIEKFIIVFLSIFILSGLSLNHKLRRNVASSDEERLFTQEEKEYFSSVFDETNRDGKVVSKKYLQILKEIENKKTYPKKEEDLAKVYYFLGYNAYLDNDKKNAEKYLEISMKKFEQIPNYFYRLNGNNILMNMAYRNNNYIEGINRANKLYEILQIPNIKSISEKKQKAIKTNVLNGLVNVSSKFEMNDMAKTYYDELIKTTNEDKTLEDNIAIYAKYIYNFRNKNYKEAQKYAQKYIDYCVNLFPNDKEIIDKSYVYLAEVLIELEDFNGVKKVFNKVIDTKAAKEDLPTKGFLYNLKAAAYEKNNMYEDAYKAYKESLSTFEESKDYENLIFVNQKLIGLTEHIDLNVEMYIKNLEQYKEFYNKDIIIGKIADLLTRTTYQKSVEEKLKIKEDFSRNLKLTSITKRINLMYLLVILLLIFMARKLKREILVRKFKEKELERMVKIDYLTKAYSKKFIFDKTKSYIIDKKDFTFIMFDLDNFKKINDTYGHNFGDEILVELIEVIKVSLGNDGYIGRFGGEEFVILLKEGVDPKKIIKSINFDIKNIDYSIKGFKVTISGGAIRWTGQTCDEIIYDADVLLYKAKSEGKNKILLR